LDRDIVIAGLRELEPALRARGIGEILDATALVEDRFPGVPVGLTTPDRLHDLYRPHIERSAVRVF
jgi:hypothetical protein